MQHKPNSNNILQAKYIFKKNIGLILILLVAKLGNFIAIKRY